MFRRSIVAAALLITLLAVLQYRWIDQLRDAERVRLRTSL
jgi:hypothetical protein